MGQRPGSGYTAARSQNQVELMSKRLLRVIVVVLAVGTVDLVAGCGQKGPLYFPEEKDKKKSEQKSSIPLAREAV